MLYFSSSQEKKKAILQNVNERSVREGWQAHGGPPKSRQQWDQQQCLDSGIFNRQPIMNDSCSGDLSVQGQAVNLSGANPPIRSQWGGAPRGTIINALEHATVYDQTVASTINSQALDIGLQQLPNHANQNRHNETFILTSSKLVTAAHPTIDIPKIPPANNGVAEALNRTLKPSSQQTNNHQ